MFLVADRHATILVPLIWEVCLPGTTTISDCWAVYQNISIDKAFTHNSVNHSHNFLAPTDSNIRLRILRISGCTPRDNLENSLGLE